MPDTESEIKTPLDEVSDPPAADETTVEELAEMAAEAEAGPAPALPGEIASIVFEKRDGKIYVVGGWPEMARISIDAVKTTDGEVVHIIVDATDPMRTTILFSCANGAAAYEFAEDHGNGVGLYRRKDWTLHPQEEPAPASPVAPDPAPAATPAALAVAPDGTQTPVPPAVHPPAPKPRKDAHLDQTKKCPECGRYVSAGHRIGCVYYEPASR